MRFLLDTNVIIGLLNRQPTVSARVLAEMRRDHALTVIVAHDLLFGALRARAAEVETGSAKKGAAQQKLGGVADCSVIGHGSKSAKRDETLAAFETLRIPVLDVSLDDARKAAEIRTALAATGTPIGPCDTLIAGQALAHNLVPVTRNTREFARVPGLAVENWENGNP